MPSAYAWCFTTESTEATERLSPLLSSFFLCALGVLCGSNLLVFFGFALHLALAGWPLIRSDQLWREHRYADGGPPEALAYKIEVFEAVARRYGFVAPTPRIPGIAYRDLDDID